MAWKLELTDELLANNYYEYNGPLTDRSLFINRNTELHDAFLTCESIVKGSIGGIFLVGGRASGKTTFLLKMQEKLSSANIPSVFIPLDESMVEKGSEIIFYRTMVERALIELKNKNLINTDIRDKILGLIRNIKQLEIGVDFSAIRLMASLSKEESPKKMDYFVLKDAIDELLKLIEKEPGNKNGIIFIFDEANVFINNRRMLEVLRNVFQHTPKIGLVLAGTMNVIDNISEVFSPMARFFKKLEIGPYPGEQYVLEAIQKPIVKTQKMLSQKYILKVNYDVYKEKINDFTNKMPMDINLLTHYAFEDACKKFNKRESVIELTYFLNKDVINSAIKELRGTFQYSNFLESLTSEEVNLLKILSSSTYSLTNVELSALIFLSKYGTSITSLETKKMMDDLINLEDGVVNIDDELKSIKQKGIEHKIEVLSKNVIGKPMYSVNDQWISIYFKINWAQQQFDMDKGFIPRFNGIYMWHDPIASCLHSIIFPRLYEYVKDGSPFKTNSRRGSSSTLKLPRNSPKRMYLIVDYQRTADYLDYYYIFNLSNTFSEVNTKFIKDVLEGLKEYGIVNNYTMLPKNS
jgi:hypothetical protein